jgi:site-specific recombinase XerD
LGVIAFPSPAAGADGSTTVGEAGDAFLSGIQTATTRTAYGETLGVLIDVAGEDFPVAALAPEVYGAVMDRWDSAAASTWNRHLSALTSFTAWANRQDLLETNPARRLTRRKPARRGDRSIPYVRLERLFADERHGLRERVLWRLVYETAARAEEILTLDIEDLDLEFKRARVTSKGGALEYVYWGTGTARLLPRLLAGRKAGPVLLADRKAPASGRRAPAAADIDPVTGRGRLSYSRAEYLFKTATKHKAYDPHGQGWTLHWLRHSALTHLAEKGRTAPELQAKSRHAHLASLGAYVKLGAETAAKVTAETDPAARRKAP